MPNSTNPLKQYFRQPAIYIKLPNQGRSWPAAAINVPPNGEMPVYPMTAIDEITYRTPDALFNSEATVSVIQSCIPNISDAWETPATDLDTILVAIRIASYGHKMDIDTSCPKCQTESSFSLDLRTVMDKFVAADYTVPVQIGDLTIHFKPLSYRLLTQNSAAQFEQQKTLQLINSDDQSEEAKVTKINQIMKTLIEFTVTTIAQSIARISATDVLVDDFENILDFLKNCDRNVYNKIRNHILDLKQKSDLQPLKITCLNCQHQYEQAFTLDMSNFFGSAS